MDTVRFFGAAAQAAGTTHETVDAETLGALITSVTTDRDDHFAAVLGRCSILVDGLRTDDRSTTLEATSVVDVLPPFAGG